MSKTYLPFQNHAPWCVALGVYPHQLYNIWRPFPLLQYHASPSKCYIFLNMIFELMSLFIGCIHRHPLMAIIIMVNNFKNARETDYDLQIGKSDIIHKEVASEWKQALLVCKSVFNMEGWTWNLMEKKLHQMPLDGWDSPGGEVNLEYLKVPSQGCL